MARSPSFFSEAMPKMALSLRICWIASVLSGEEAADEDVDGSLLVFSSVSCSCFSSAGSWVDSGEEDGVD